MCRTYLLLLYQSAAGAARGVEAARRADIAIKYNTNPASPVSEQKITARLRTRKLSLQKRQEV
ncbi:MAG TPA: hypothetical protein DEP61_00650 [Lachnospiraceae bacterium]|nr:hypothetical protein [Lachnospiraceae bacterium]